MKRLMMLLVSLLILTGCNRSATRSPNRTQEQREVLGNCALAGFQMEVWIRSVDTDQRPQVEEALVGICRDLGIGLDPDPVTVRTRVEAVRAVDNYSHAAIDHLGKVSSDQLWGFVLGFFSGKVGNYTTGIFRRGSEPTSADQTAIAEALNMLGKASVHLGLSRQLQDELSKFERENRDLKSLSELLAFDGRLFEWYLRACDELGIEVDRSDTHVARWDPIPRRVTFIFICI